MDAVEVATAPIDDVERLHGSSDHVYLTCPERDGACTYTVEPDRPDDYPLAFLLDYPYCVECGVSLVIVPRREYDGPGPRFRDLDQNGSPVVAMT